MGWRDTSSLGGTEKEVGNERKEVGNMNKRVDRTRREDDKKGKGFGMLTPLLYITLAHAISSSFYLMSSFPGSFQVMLGSPLNYCEVILGAFWRHLKVVLGTALKYV